MLIQPSPNPVMTMTRAPIVCARVPSGGRANAFVQSMLFTVRMRNSTVNAPVSQVSTDCSFMIV